MLHSLETEEDARNRFKEKEIVKCSRYDMIWYDFVGERNLPD